MKPLPKMDVSPWWALSAPAAPDERAFVAADGMARGPLATEQALLQYLSLLSLWHWLNNAYQGNGEAFLTAEQVRTLKQVEGRMEAVAQELPTPLVQESQALLHRCLSVAGALDSESLG